MKINSVVLENIRSYEYEKIIFENGITLLSGDIGSGKTTILLAIEFALFGLIKGKVNSEALLRHGANLGSVIVSFNVNNQDIIIKRVLKKSNTSIKQDTGLLTVDGIEEELTPQELRAKIVKLLGYPADLINKSPSIIYRYTVYTPQEDMKLILFETSDSRMETIRKIFNIDKYKIIRNNVSIYVKELNARIRENKAKTEDIDELTQKIKEIEDQKTILNKEIDILSADIEVKNKEVRLLNADINKLEGKILEQNTLKQKIIICKTKITSLNSQKISISKQIKDIQEQIKEKPKSEIIDVDKIILDLNELDKNRKEILKKQQDYLNKKAILESRIKEINLMVEKISALDNCPTCRQNVGVEHKILIKNQEKEKINSANETLSKLIHILPKFDEKFDIINKKIKDFQELINQSKLTKIKLDNYNDKIKLKQEFEDNIKKIESDFVLENQRLDKFSADIDINLLSEYDKKKDLFKIAQEKLKQLEIKLSSSRKEFEMKQENINYINNQIQDKKKTLLEINEQIVLRNWFEKFFLKLMQSIEKHVLNSILKEFNEYFQQWFDMLIEEDSISVKLDDSFTPIIEQNGYETFIQNLSGGEKTSVALAYRLALNKVINDFVSTVKTRDLIILDEPTDGFSSAQLDKLRDVLVQINSDQIILVSHETKLESYADNILRIVKEHHISSLN